MSLSINQTISNNISFQKIVHPKKLRSDDIVVVARRIGMSGNDSQFPDLFLAKVSGIDNNKSLWLVKDGDTEHVSRPIKNWHEEFFFDRTEISKIGKSLLEKIFG